MPATLAAKKFIFMPTSSPEWTAVHVNSKFDIPYGTGNRIARNLKCQYVLFAFTPKGLIEVNGGQYMHDEIIFYSFDCTASLEKPEIRGVYLTYEGGWCFETQGSPFPFENTEKYNEKMKKTDSQLTWLRNMRVISTFIHLMNRFIKIMGL